MNKQEKAPGSSLIYPITHYTTFSSEMLNVNGQPNRWKRDFLDFLTSDCLTLDKKELDELLFQN